MYKGFMIDLDGTVYRGSEPIPAAKRFIEKLQIKEIPFLFLTNNTTKTPKEVQKNLAHNFSIEVPETSIYTAGLATVEYMEQMNFGKKVYVIGAQSLITQILTAGFIWDEKRPDYVVVGLDPTITYEKLTIATLAIQKGAHFIGTNPDKNIPSERGLLPGAGSFLRFFETSTQTKPVIIGKPQAAIVDRALIHLGTARHETLIVGDNYLTDIQAGIKNDVDTLLVLTGFTAEADVPNLEISPTYVRKTLDDWRF